MVSMGKDWWDTEGVEIREAVIRTDSDPMTLTRDENGMLYLNIPSEPSNMIMEIDPDDMRRALDYVTATVIARMDAAEEAADMLVHCFRSGVAPHPNDSRAVLEAVEGWEEAR